MQQEDIIKDIRTRCRMGMNGITSTSMRQKGLAYKVNFGLAIQQIKELSERYQPDKELAETLWKEDTRELKILATLLYPVAEFTEETANEWVTAIPNQEIREQVCMNLFQNLPFAGKVAIEWGGNADEDIRTTGYWLVARLYLIKKAENILPDAFNYIWNDAVSDNISLRNAALQALKHIGRQSESTADNILKKLSVYKESSDLVKQEAYNGLAFEFEYYFDK
ncbi:3-methyladenine DNA glycosylase AlkD [Dysgonomonas sp. PFB1-18]|uniref:DNA alkylation repair protein n=1 Tax=unclassified Dysgonomonas TaxID=2630389 RepID=UPI002476DD8B|nr:MULTISPECIES: DNA alkylation repair protein [unclassified Dysgonomonas]MDH6310799.1 3-methyladenine DNA glycosylase AlkD [Dysgonomonas sp. PF1-14]MDH6340649.1 3-methyladenine DNA glycosylase AlkD [Dysgonomonas sp. PF1-16]MDH6382244.1 3-methyladenine DNA glycosylase AlkD [Dysgonomonas sp. PFB1-18]MDH6399619.1 3-methyladenine DNA glycosylase AlkD [Dysgonomonas sp. PF1-23]